MGEQEYRKILISAFPKSKRNKVRGILQECANILRKWFKAQIIDMVIIGSITAIGLWVSGIEYWAVFGLLTAVLGIIPYVGIVIVVVLATILTLATNPTQLWNVLLVFGITQQIEGNLVLPLVMKGKVQLPEVPLLIFMLLLGSILGILGIFLAPPIFAIMKVLYEKLYLPHMEKK